jgi:hypothetical protein
MNANISVYIQSRVYLNPRSTVAQSGLEIIPLPDRRCVYYGELGLSIGFWLQ